MTVKQRWDETDAYKISAQRAKSYTDADWQKLEDEQGSTDVDAIAAPLRRQHR